MNGDMTTLLRQNTQCPHPRGTVIEETTLISRRNGSFVGDYMCCYMMVAFEIHDSNSIESTLRIVTKTHSSAVLHL